METKEVLQKNELKFKKTLIMVRVLLVLIFGLIAFIQQDQLLKLIKWFSGN